MYGNMIPPKPRNLRAAETRKPLIMVALLTQTWTGCQHAARTTAPVVQLHSPLGREDDRASIHSMSAITT